MDTKGSGGCLYYKWIILIAACSSQFLRSTFLFGTLPVPSIYYEEQFSDRQLSSMIGPIQTALSFGGGEVQIINKLLKVWFGQHRKLAYVYSVHSQLTLISYCLADVYFLSLLVEHKKSPPPQFFLLVNDSCGQSIRSAMYGDWLLYISLFISLLL